MAVRADQEGLAPHRGHELRPRGLWPPRAGEVSEFTDLVCLHRGASLAPLASSRRESADQLLAADGDRGWLTVEDDRFPLPFQGDAAEPGDQWFPALSFHSGFEACAWPVRCLGLGLVLAGHLRHRRAMLGGQCLEHRGLKENLAQLFGTDPRAYNDAKTTFIEQVLQTATRDRSGRNSGHPAERHSDSWNI